MFATKLSTNFSSYRKTEAIYTYALAASALLIVLAVIAAAVSPSFGTWLVDLVVLNKV